MSFFCLFSLLCCVFGRRWLTFLLRLLFVMIRNHASNAYMLHALGITHVVSVGECALVPPVNGADENRWLLWTEEREGRIKVLDIKVCFVVFFVFVVTCTD